VVAHTVAGADDLTRHRGEHRLTETGGRVAVLIWSFLLFGTLATLTVISQGRQLFGG
jgi:hypothetical protein